MTLFDPGRTLTKLAYLEIDSTFNIGKFDVPNTTYKHLLLETRKADDTGKRASPLLIGPALIHAKKDEYTCQYFSQPWYM